MRVEDIIYSELLFAGREMGSKELSELEGVGGQTYVSRILRKMIGEGKVAARRDGRNVFYRVTNQKVAYDGTVGLKGLHEDELWQGIPGDFFEDLSEQASSILEFTFTEMLNNAIDHSRSGTSYVKVWRDRDIAKFTVRDYGIGIFRGVMAKKGFPSEIVALREILKGRLTTNPEWHSGEGIFWTSKIADKVVIESYGLRLTIDNIIGDYAVEQLEESLLGTEVRFEIMADTEKSMIDIFHAYSFDHEKTILDTTDVPIKLYDGGETWISRSQAKKMLQGLEKFKKITLDFKGIKLIGQGFADEVFRVFRNHHPETEIEVKNANESVQLMIKHVTTG